MPDSNVGDQVKLPPIGAMFRGPGPGRYMLPTLCSHQGHDGRKKRNPAYSFGNKHLHSLTNDCSPGPRYLQDSRVTKTGLDGNPKYSMLGNARFENLSKLKVPGPGQYSPEKQSVPHERKAPSYSFGSRTKYAQKNVTPSPNSYSLPPLLGPKAVGKRSAASYSLTGRSNIGGFAEDLQKTPGPGTYKVTQPDVMKSKKPVYSINGRNFMPGDSTQIPGPGQHSPEKVYMHKKEAPKFSFGTRHSDFTLPLIVDVSD